MIRVENATVSLTIAILLHPTGIVAIWYLKYKGNVFILGLRKIDVLDARAFKGNNKNWTQQNLTRQPWKKPITNDKKLKPIETLKISETHEDSKGS